jgi:hypothetical protein
MMFQTHSQAADMALATPLEPKGRPRQSAFFRLRADLKGILT